MSSEIERKIADYAAKLATLEGPENKRVKKRVLAQLGKLKKELKLFTNAAVKIHGDKYVADSGLSEPDEKNTEGTLSRKHLKGKLKLLNKELADYAQKKQLKTAIKRFSWGVRKGMEPDKHTYANLLNCYVRCGDLEGALQRFADMREANLIPNIVIYTTLLKGYCDIGDLSGAKNLLFTEMLEKNILPGIRTVNTFIRGCTKIGAVTSALRAYYLLKDKSNASDLMDDSGVVHIDKKRKISRDDSDDEDEGDEELSGENTNRSSASHDSSMKGEIGDADQCGGYSSLFESVVALLCQALIIDKASLLAIEAVSSVESFGGTETSQLLNHMCCN
jgi:pentatricopeptide repeat protein